jgi:hypothetical protein
MRIRVIDVLDLFAAGLSAEQILKEMPDLEKEDLQAASSICLSAVVFRVISWIVFCNAKNRSTKIHQPALTNPVRLIERLH